MKKRIDGRVGGKEKKRKAIVNNRKEQDMR